MRSDGAVASETGSTTNLQLLVLVFVADITEQLKLKKLCSFQTSKTKIWPRNCQKTKNPDEIYAS